MAGGLINIISYGANDLYLTGTPEITFFKMIFRRHTNFSKESIGININNINFNEKIEIVIPKTGDLLQELYLNIQIPSISILKTQVGITTDQTIQNNALNDYNEALADYNNIVNFMNINTQAYITAYNDNKTLNLPCIVMINDIINVFSNFSSSPSVVGKYKNILNAEYNTLINQNENLNINKYVWLLPQFSDISYIINNINTDITSNTNLWTNATILQTLTNAINTSIKVQEYFYKKQLLLYDKYNDISSQYVKFAWNEKLGYNIIDSIDLMIGGEKIDTHTGQWLEILDQQSGNFYQEKTKNIMIGNVPQLTTFDRTPKPSYTLNIPLQFFFCKNTGLTLPLIALKYNNVSLVVNLKRFEDCAYYERNPNVSYENVISLTDIWEDQGYLLNGTLYADYIYLDALERKRFAQTAHEYLINRTQILTYKNITSTQNTLLLDYFQNPAKEIIWTVQKQAYIDNYTSYYKSRWNDYTLFNNKGCTINNAKILFNGYTRIDKINGSYYNLVQHYQHHTNSVNEGIYNYSFSLHPEETQPSGSCNFTRISNITMEISLNPLCFYYNRSDIDMTINKIQEQQTQYPAVWKYYSEPIDVDNIDINDGTNDNTIDDTQLDSFRQTKVIVTFYLNTISILRIAGGFGSLAFQ
jgi:hypothetical protein